MDELTEEERLVHDMAVEYFKQQGLHFEVVYIAGHKIEDQVQVYGVSGNVLNAYCQECRRKHEKRESLLFLRTEQGFTLLKIGECKRLKPDFLQFPGLE